MSITFAQIAEAHSDYDPAYPNDWPQPSRAELDSIERSLGIRYSDEFRAFQLEACHSTPIGDEAWDNFGWAEPSLAPMENLRSIAESARSTGVPVEYAAFKGNNGDYYCCKPDGTIVIWDHNANSEELDPSYRWESFTSWLASTFESES